MTRRIVVALCATTAFAFGSVITGAPRAAADTSGQDNVAVAVNTNDGSAVFRFAFNITRVTGEVADAGNAAVAFASCTDCQTVAIAIQVVLIEGSPDVFTPENIAIAMNVECSHCDTLASAYQFVFQENDGLLRLSPDGQRRLREILIELRGLRDSGLASSELQARIDSYADQIYAVFSEELVVVGEPGVNATTTTVTLSVPTTAGSVTSTTHGPTTTTSGSTASSTTTTTAAPTTTTTTTTAPATTTTAP